MDENFVLLNQDNHNDTSTQNLFDFNSGNCNFCGEDVASEVEARSGICLNCAENEEHVAKLDAFDDLVAICKSCLNLSDIIEQDIRQECRMNWNQVSQDMCRILRTSHSIGFTSSWEFGFKHP